MGDMEPDKGYIGAMLEYPSQGYDPSMRCELQSILLVSARTWRLKKGGSRGHNKIHPLPAPPNYPLIDPKYHLIETTRPLIEVHWGVQEYGPTVHNLDYSSYEALSSTGVGP